MGEDKPKTESKSIHDGHRKRMKQRYAETGIEGLDDHELLEMLLFYSIPRKDTNTLAHEIIEHFGSFEGVMEASVEELMQVKGVTEHTATLISLVPQMNKRYLERRSIEKKVIKTSDEAGSLLISKFAYETNECAYVILLDGKSRLITCRKISQGIVNGTDISIRALCETALKFKASSVIVSHNHPSGVLMPSAEDEQCTRMIKDALNVIGIRLTDHVIVAGDKFISMARYGMV